MHIGYVRVSTKEQNVDRQVEMLTEKYQVEKFFIDKTTGVDADRPQLNAMLDFIRSGDVIVIESYSRLARSTTDLLTLTQQLADKEVHLISDKEQIDTTTPTGKLFLTIISGIAQFEREILLQRQAEGIALAKMQGKYNGRKRKEIDTKKFAETYDLWKNKEEITAVEAARRLGVSTMTFYRRVHEFEAGLTGNEESEKKEGGCP